MVSTLKSHFFLKDVSIIMPVRNCREYIHEAVNSILNQDFINFEIIIIDDGSTDYDYDQLRLIDNRISVYHLSGLGVSRARNLGMQHSVGHYIAFLDADDVWFPGKLTAQIRYLEQFPEVGCSFGRFLKWMPDEGNLFPPLSNLAKDCSHITANDAERSGWIYTRLLIGLLVGMNTAVIRREVFENLGGFDETMHIGEDYLFWLKVSRVYEMHALDGNVALYRIHPASAMHQLDAENHQAELLDLAVKRWGLQCPDGTQLAKHDFQQRVGACVFDHGYKHFWRGQPKVAAKSFFQSLKLRYRPLRSMAYMASLLFQPILKRLRSH